MSEQGSVGFCHSHGRVPLCLVCVHVVRGEAERLYQAPTTPGDELYDWVCGDCFDGLFKEPGGIAAFDDHLLVSVCMDCARNLTEGVAKVTEETIRRCIKADIPREEWPVEEVV